MIDRTIKDNWLKMVATFRVLSLTGPRQSGKTTFLKNNLKGYRYINLENPDNLEYAEKDPRGFLKEYDDKVIIDEAQKAPKLFSYIQEIVDVKNTAGQYVLSGSQNFLLSKNISQSLAGRTGIMRLFPFENREIGSLINKNPWEQCFKGYYPEIYDKEIQSPSLYYKNYIDTYIKRDIYDLLNIQNESQFLTFIKILATHVGQELNLQSISKQTGISHTTASNWLSILETSYIIYRLYPFYKNYNKRLIKSPKIYFYDTGIVCQLLGFKSAEDLKVYASRGSVFENLVISEMQKQNAHAGPYRDLYFWKESHQTEIDLLIPEPSGMHIYEIKSSETLSKDKFDGLQKFEKISDDLISTKTLIHAGENEKHQRYGCEVVPWNEVTTP
jgi:uncharacterized protein